MVVVMQAGAEESQVQAVIERLYSYGFDVHRSSGANQVVLGAIGVKPEFDARHIRVLDGVAEVYRVTEPYKFASRAWRRENTVIDVRGVPVGGPEVVVMAGPCAVESEAQIEATAAHVAAHGATFLRGGPLRPRPTPHAVHGLGEASLRLLRQAADRHGLRVVTEVTDAAQVDRIGAYTDVFLVGARNMHNFALLHALGQADRPVLLKRGPAATIEEWLMSADYVMASGNPHVVCCEGGIRTFETYTRYTLDLSAVPVLKKKSHLPVFVDPSHGTGLRDKVLPMGRAAVAAGADGLLVEVHPDPPSARGDGPQSLYFEQFAELMRQLRLIAGALGRSLHAPEPAPP